MLNTLFMSQITLVEIEKAMRMEFNGLPIFNFDDKSEKKLDLKDAPYPYKPVVPRIVFCGIAKLQNHTIEDIQKYLEEKNKQQVKTLIFQFCSAYNEGYFFELKQIPIKITSDYNTLSYDKYKKVCHVLNIDYFAGIKISVDQMIS